MYVNGQRVYVYPSAGFADAGRLQGKAARVKDSYLGTNGQPRLCVELEKGDPRPVFSRTPDGVLYLDPDEVSLKRRRKS